MVDTQLALGAAMSPAENGRMFARQFVNALARVELLASNEEATLAFLDEVHTSRIAAWARPILALTIERLLAYRHSYPETPPATGSEATATRTATPAAELARLQEAILATPAVRWYRASLLPLLRAMAEDHGLPQPPDLTPETAIAWLSTEALKADRLRRHLTTPPNPPATSAEAATAP